MADIEKVIKGLEFCTSTTGCKGCPYEDPCHDIEQRILGEAIMRDALELLKEQQAEIERLKEQKPVKPIQFEKKSRITRDKYECGACGSSEIYKEWDFCPWCGKPIDWEGR